MKGGGGGGFPPNFLCFLALYEYIGGEPSPPPPFHFYFLFTFYDNNLLE
jgi:hypothetical protein